MEEEEGEAWPKARGFLEVDKSTASSLDVGAKATMRVIDNSDGMEKPFAFSRRHNGGCIIMCELLICYQSCI